MTYIPRVTLNDTNLPTASGKDLTTICALLKEKWKKFYPKIDYYMIKNEPVEDADGDMVSGVAGESIIDELWGEEIPLSAAAPWIQPHADESLDATAGEKFETKTQVNAALQSELSEKQLKKMGLDEVKDVVITVPTALLDEAGISASIGDKFDWDGTTYEVINMHLKQRWFNTNVYLYLIANCARREYGS